MKKIGHRKFVSEASNLYPHSPGAIPLHGATDETKLANVLFPPGRDTESLRGNFWQGSWQVKGHKQ